ncbi:A24 family peptidase [Georgenia daeguensis]|uniref:Prepilin type IV endopeptidase peptidase domain-containing protein n=1 Tax=Georgenia daeguensis TaxID=908355 RepID=A0ABP8EQY2_9MICO
MSGVWLGATAAFASAGGAVVLKKSVSGHVRPSSWSSSLIVVVLAAAGGAGAAIIGTTWAEMLAFSVLSTACAVLIVIDLAEHRLPDVVVLPMYPAVLVLLTLAAAVNGQWSDLGRSVVAGAVLLTVYFAMAYAYPAGLGLGDVKLSGVLGMFLGWFGWPHVVLGTFAAFAINAIVVVVLLVLRKATLKSDVPFGPPMIAGAAVGAAWGPVVFPGVA